DATLLAAPLSAEAVTVVKDSFADAIVASSFPVEGVNCDVLMADSVESGRLAARHICRGASNDDVLYVHNPAIVGADGRLQGFESQCRGEGLDPEAITLRLPAAWQSGRPLAALTDRIGKAGRIAASDDFTAVTVMMICQRLGRTPGEDVAVMGQDNERVGALISPGLTTIDLNGKEIGRRAMETLLARVEETRADAAQTVAIAPRLVARESTRHLS
ncbi:MAG: LacI family DNA-binding transcriptional regulator, partial [Planctomycetes bacterium]|nr:LacI family DNA-binding transcriptional regulator [Planctomycetota bacterium]